MRRLVLPGEILADKPLKLDDIVVEDGKTCATVIGIYDDERQTLIPLEGLWYPKAEERIIGIIEEEKLNTYVVNLNAPYKGIIISKYVDESRIKNGDIVEAIVRERDKTGTIVLSRPRVLYGGKVIYVKPSKIPRVIGKANTMIRQLSLGTKSDISVGMNGLIWMKGGDIDLATEAILKIQDEAHISGLTERINEMLSKASEGKARDSGDKQDA